MPQFWHILVTPISDWKWIRKMISLSEIRDKKEGPVNPQWSARDYLAIVGGILANQPPIHVALFPDPNRGYECLNYGAF